MKTKLILFLLLIPVMVLAQSNVRVVERNRTPAITTASASGTVAAGAIKVTFIFSADFAGTVLGATFSGATDASVTIDAPLNDRLAAIAYTRSAGSVRILTIR